MRPKRLLRRLEECGSLVQVALDFDNLLEAIGVVARLGEPGRAVILEAGTPLLKSMGTSAIEALKAFPWDHLVMADTKTVDAGYLEASIVSKAGADALSVLSVASHETLEETVKASEELGVSVYGDLIASTNPVGDAEKLRKTGVDVALLHIGIDVQKRLGITAIQLRDLIGQVKREFKGPIAVAGGIKPAEVSSLVEAGADIVIIGSAITRAPDPGSALREALKRAGARC
ncbi:MAG: orotidine 5'-phosphate decarboxylase [Desulfurococcales archaeon]|nr:orotidine 5'-phosphate decarboxylase [Desulfurococcales archaeon]